MVQCAVAIHSSHFSVRLQDIHRHIRLVGILSPLRAQQPRAHAGVGRVKKERLVVENLPDGLCVITFERRLPCS